MCDDTIRRWPIVAGRIESAADDDHLRVISAPTGTDRRDRADRARSVAGAVRESTSRTADALPFREAQDRRHRRTARRDQPGASLFWLQSRPVWRDNWRLVSGMGAECAPVAPDWRFQQ